MEEGDGGQRFRGHLRRRPWPPTAGAATRGMSPSQRCGSPAAADAASVRSLVSLCPQATGVRSSRSSSIGALTSKPGSFYCTAVRRFRHGAALWPRRHSYQDSPAIRVNEWRGPSRGHGIGNGEIGLRPLENTPGRDPRREPGSDPCSSTRPGPWPSVTGPLTASPHAPRAPNKRLPGRHPRLWDKTAYRVGQEVRDRSAQAQPELARSGQPGEQSGRPPNTRNAAA